ncbi:MAG TPA: sugar ABC transporter permease [Candidatus Pelethenecus faecipullorum]|uniref:Maltose/maltodextrin transport system permease protein n=1 Tax=Candidatus Pelethenecus faecipullorum TaxID=2840900 RepID=A0A9D1GSC0_9MOLU|nr:sugar ABC transporter permease [Candidatus Pelethenecus faecipullorum]
MTTIEYLALPGYKRVFYKFIAFFAAIPHWFGVFFTKKIPNFFVRIYRKIAGLLVGIYNIFVDGDWKTRLSYLIMGFGQITRKSYLRGFLVLIYEIFFIYYIVSIGAPSLAKLGTFGYVAQATYTHPVLGIEVSSFNDDSFLILLNSIIAIILMVVYFVLWCSQISDSANLQNLNAIGKKVTDRDTIRDLTGKNYHKVLLAFPTFGLVMFTIIPLVFSIIVAFTNYSSDYQSPKELFDWVGMYNFKKLFGMTGGGFEFTYVFGQILLWTLIWAFFATFTNYFLGMIVALIINKKGIRLKKLWRTVLITTIAVPQFISLLFLSKFLSTDSGAFNFILRQLGLISENIKFLEDGLIAKITIIVVNMWIGIPYTMLMCSGLLMNIPQDLYESARIDGASPIKMYMKITLPYMLFVTGPYLISTFVGNINNFNVIYLLSGGNPMFTNVNGVLIKTNIYGAGETDLLITWLYKIAMTQVSKDYGVASVIGIFVFIIVAGFSLIFYSRSNAVKNEGDFQ